MDQKQQNLLKQILKIPSFHKVKKYHNRIQTQFMIKPRTSQEQSGNYPFFHQNKNNTIKYHTRNQSHFYAQNYFPSDDEEYYKRNHLRFYSSQKPRSYSIDQPDIFEPFTRNEQIRQPRNNPISYNNIFRQQNPVDT